MKIYDAIPVSECQVERVFSYLTYYLDNKYKTRLLPNRIEASAVINFNSVKKGKSE